VKISFELAQELLLWFLGFLTLGYAMEDFTMEAFPILKLFPMWVKFDSAPIWVKFCFNLVFVYMF